MHAVVETSFVQATKTGIAAPATRQLTVTTGVSAAVAIMAFPRLLTLEERGERAK